MCESALIEKEVGCWTVFSWKCDLLWNVEKPPPRLITRFITLWRIKFLSHLLLTVCPSWQRAPLVNLDTCSTVVAYLQHVQDRQARLRSKADRAMSYLAYISTYSYSGKRSHLNGRERDRRRVEACA